MPSYFLVAGNSVQNVNPVQVEKYVGSSCDILRFDEDAEEAMKILERLTDTDIKNGALKKYVIDLQPQMSVMSVGLNDNSESRSRSPTMSDAEKLMQDVENQIATRED